MENTRGKGRGGRRGHKTGVVNRGSARGSVQGDTVPAAVGAVKRQHFQMADFLRKLAGPQGTTLTDPHKQESVQKWMAESTSSQTSTAPSSSHDSPWSGPVNPPPRPPSPQPYSLELYSEPIPDLLPEEILCPDSQDLVQSQGDKGRDLSVAFEEVVDDDQTQVSGGEVAGRAFSQSVDSEEELADDEGTDPTWTDEAHQESGSESEVASASAPHPLGIGSGLGRGRSRARATTPPSGHAPVRKHRVSVVWKYFSDEVGDRRVALCKLCHTKISRGVNIKNLTTTSMRKHLEKKHPTKWLALQSAGDCDTAAAAPVSHAVSDLLAPSQDTPASSPAMTPANPYPSTASNHVSKRSASVQLSLEQTFERKRKYAAIHPHAQALNVQISKLLSLEMLPYRLVETEAFRNLMEVAAPRYLVPSRHYFSRVAIPALHQHVSENIICALTNAASEKVHLTTDTWTSAGGQGHYISLTAHWVNLVEAGTESDPGAAHVLPTPRIAGPTSVTVSQTCFTSSSHPSSTSSSESPSVGTAPSVGSSRRSSSAVGKRQQAVLKLLSLGDKRHTAQELLQGITAQTNLWLAPLNLKAGMVVCDNGRNLVAALQLGRLTHVPCLAHVFNLIVQRFLKTYPNLSDLLTKVRRICAHFRKSTTDAATLRAAQRRLQLPAHRLLCDVPTRWNSTLNMLSRVYQQRRAIVDCQMSTSTRTGSQVPQVYNEEWTWMSDICQVLSNFEESTQMVSGDATIISVTIPLLCLLKKSLLSMKSEALRLSQEMGEEDTLLDSQTTLRSVSQHVLEEEEENEEEEEEEEETVGETEEGTNAHSFLSVQRVWAEEEELEEEEMESQPIEEREFLRVGTLAHMADFMLGCLSRDPRVRSILDNTDYWVFTLLDPRYKQNFSTLIPVEERSMRVNQYQQALVHKLKLSFPSDTASGRGRSSVGQLAGERRGAGSLSSTGRGTLSKAFASFMAPQQDYVTSPQSRQSRGELFRKMVREYLADHTNVSSDHSAPYNYWVSNLDTWPELALYALEVLACPAASVLSERVFSAAGGIITDKRTRLSTDSADRLTIIKMNKAWISPEFKSPPGQSSST